MFIYLIVCIYFPAKEKAKRLCEDDDCEREVS